MADIGKAWPVLIVCGGLLPLFLSVIWLLMIRHFVGAMPWITVALFDILIISVTMFYYLKGQIYIFLFSFPANGKLKSLSQVPARKSFTNFSKLM